MNNRSDYAKRSGAAELLETHAIGVRYRLGETAANSLWDIAGRIRQGEPIADAAQRLRHRAETFSFLRWNGAATVAIEFSEVLEGLA